MLFVYCNSEQLWYFTVYGELGNSLVTVLRWKQQNLHNGLSNKTFYLMIKKTLIYITKGIGN